MKHLLHIFLTSFTWCIFAMEKTIPLEIEPSRTSSPTEFGFVVFDYDPFKSYTYAMSQPNQVEIVAHITPRGGDKIVQIKYVTQSGRLIPCTSSLAEKYKETTKSLLYSFLYTKLYHTLQKPFTQKNTPEKNFEKIKKWLKYLQNYNAFNNEAIRMYHSSTPYHLAIEHNKRDAFNYFIAHGLNINITAHDRHTALDICVACDEEVAQSRKEYAQILFENGGKVAVSENQHRLKDYFNLKAEVLEN